MTYLSCDVTNCINNANEMCVRSGIKVDGCDATREAETCCASYGSRGTSYENAVSANLSATPETDIACDVERCRYQSDNACTARNIHIGGCGACECTETSCRTFEQR